MEIITKNLEKLKIWSENCPSNFLHKFYLLSAEISILKNDTMDNILTQYKLSLESIGENDFVQMKALINELQGIYLYDKGQIILGRACIREAYYLYQKWGALRKIALMEQEYKQIFFSQDSYQNIERRKSSHDSVLDSHSITSGSIDMSSIIKFNQAISSEIKIDKLLKTLMNIIIENAGAQHGSLLLKNESDNKLYIEAMKKPDTDEIDVMQSIPYKECKCLCADIIQFVVKTMESIVLNDACNEGNFQNNPYIKENKVKSVLCMPILYQNTLKSVVYLENNFSDNVFTTERISILKILSSQASISIDNANLYKNLEDKVRERTIQLHNANERLKELSLLDPLTSLHNRRYIYEFVTELSVNFINNKIRILNNNDKRDLSINNKVMGVCLIDIDHFKEVNDTYGHVAGDNVLITISNALKKMIRSDDFIVRWGGEEFLIILHNTKPEFLEIFSKKVINTIKKTPLKLFENKTIFKSCSLGYAMMPFDKNHPQLLSLEQIINLSDYALYQAKENGRNQAANIKLKNKDNIDDALKNYLINLSKNSEINYDYIGIEFIK